MSKARTVAVLVVSVLLAVLYLLTGLGKFLDPQTVARFAHWGWPDWLRVAVGCVELGCGVLLLWPRAAPFAAVPLAVTMAGAIATHAKTAGERPMALVPLAFLAGLAFVGWSRLQQRRQAA
jgi:uncharacterized membrane protein YphA (DoxX/SURF4 family)